MIVVTELMRSQRMTTLVARLLYRTARTVMSRTPARQTVASVDVTVERRDGRAACLADEEPCLSTDLGIAVAAGGIRR